MENSRKFMLLRLLLLCLLPLTLSSCASILNRSKQRVYVSHDPGVEIISLNDVAASKSKSGFLVPRGPDPLYVRFKIDTLERTTPLVARNSFAYYLNFTSWGLGYILESQSPRRFSYPRNVYLEVNDGRVEALDYFPPRPKRVDFVLSSNFFNTFKLLPETGLRRARTAGFLGLEMGVDYYYDHNQYYAFNIGGAMNSPYVIAPPVDADFLDLTTTSYISFRKHAVFGNVEPGFGLNLSSLSLFTEDEWTRQFAFHENIGLGGSFSLRIRTGSSFYLSALYQPNIFRFYKGIHFVYQDFLSFQLTWRNILKPGDLIATQRR